jgi:large subunit ribosomal protein L21
MFAVIKTGGKQYKISEGDEIAVEKLTAEEGATVSFDDILMVDGQVGAPVVEGASVTAEVLKQFKGDKVIVFKKKRRHNYRRKRGHRQNHTLVKITSIKSA